MGIATELLEKIGLKVSEGVLEKGGARFLETLVEKVGEGAAGKIAKELGEKGIEKLATDYSPKILETVAEKLGPKEASKIGAKEFTKLVEQEARAVGRQGFIQGTKEAAITASKSAWRGAEHAGYLVTRPLIGGPLALTGLAYYSPSIIGHIKDEFNKLTPEQQGAARDAVGGTTQPEMDARLAAWIAVHESPLDLDGLNAVKKDYDAYRAKEGELSFKDYLSEWEKEKKKSFLEKSTKALSDVFSDPKSFGTGSLIGAVALGLAGGWLGGGFSVTGVILGVVGALVGMAVPALVNSPSVAPVPAEKDAAKKDEGKVEEKKVDPKEKKPEAEKTSGTDKIGMIGVSPTMLGAMTSQALPKVDLVGNKNKASNPTV